MVTSVEFKGMKGTGESEEIEPTTGGLPTLPRRRWTSTSEFSAFQGPCLAERQSPP